MTILIIEDDPGLSDLLNERLEEYGYLTHCVDSATSALSYIDEQIPGLMILDYSLPDKNGHEFIEQLNQTRHFCPPYIVSTSTGDEKIAVKMMKLGARDYIVKDSLYLELLPEIVYRIERELQNELKLKNSETALAESNRFNNQIIQSAREGIIVYDLDTNYLVWNPFMEKMTGILASEIIGKQPLEVFPFLKDIGVYQTIENALKGISCPELEVEFHIPSSGKSGWASDNTSPLYNANNEIIGVITTVRDITERKENEKAIKLLSTAVEQSANTIVITDKNGIIEYANPRFTHITGYETHEALGQNTRILNSGILPKEYYKEMWQSISNGNIWKGEFHNKTKNGNFFWESVTISPIENENGEIINYLAIKEDITALKESELRLKTLIKTIPDAIFLKDGNGRWLEANESGLKLFNLQDNNYIGKTNKELAEKSEFYKEPFINCEKSDELAWNEAKSIIVEEIFPIPDTTPKIYELYKVPLFNENNSRKGLVIVGKDITERINKEKEIIAAKEKAEENEYTIRIKNKELSERNIFIQTVLDNLPIGVALNKFDEGNATYMNMKFEEIYGWPSNEIVSVSSFFEKVYPDRAYRKSIVDKIIADINTGLAENMHWENITVTGKDGKCKIVNAANIPLFDQNTMVSTVIDITELYQIQQDLLIAKDKIEESNHLKTAFLQNLSHEIRTPMNAIVGFSGFLSNPGLSVEKRNSFVSIIKNSSNQLLSIVNDILTISSIETGQEKIYIDKVSINDLILELLSIFKIQALDQNILIYTKQSLSDSQSTVYTDKTKITQILTNLISNALKFTHKGFIEYGYTLREGKDETELDIENDKTKHDRRLEMQFYVKDTGIGIQFEQQEKIFERFRQADLSVNKKYGGTGLGLSISKGFVELLQGEIWVESIPEKGSTFYFTIPFKPAVKTDLTNLLKPANKKISTILIAEDEEYNFLLIEELFDDKDIQFIHAKDGVEAIELSKSNPQINLVLMDIKMPRLDGHSAAIKIKEFAPHLPIIALTAYALQHEVQKYKSTVFEEYIIKPIFEDELIKAVKQYIDI